MLPRAGARAVDRCAVRAAGAGGGRLCGRRRGARSSGSHRPDCAIRLRSAGRRAADGSHPGARRRALPPDPDHHQGRRRALRYRHPGTGRQRAVPSPAAGERRRAGGRHRAAAAARLGCHRSGGGGRPGDGRHRFARPAAAGRAGAGAAARRRRPGRHHPALRFAGQPPRRAAGGGWRLHGAARRPRRRVGQLRRHLGERRPRSPRLRPLLRHAPGGRAARRSLSSRKINARLRTLAHAVPSVVGCPGDGPVIQECSPARATVRVGRGELNMMRTKTQVSARGSETTETAGARRGQT